LAKLGRQLVAVHLLECVPDAGYGKFEVEGDNRVERVRYDEVTRRVFINATQFFAPVPLRFGSSKLALTNLPESGWKIVGVVAYR
jgi:hypothetical protein